MNYLIYGTSFNLINDEILKIVKEEKFNTLSLLDITINDLLDDISYNSMFDEKKIIVVKNFETLFQSKKDNSESIGLLKNYLTRSNEHAVLIFISYEKISDRSKNNKDLLSKLEIITTPIISKAYELSKIIGDLIKKEGYGITQNALNVFSEKCACNYDIALMEFNKLKTIKKDDRLITDKDIEEYVSNYNMTDSFGIKDAIINKDIKKALLMLDDAETSKMEIVPIVVMLAKEYQIVYNIKMLAKEKLMNDKIGEKMGGMHPFRVKLLREAANKYTEEELINIIKFLCNLDLKLVSQDNLGYDELKKFLLEL